MPYYHCRSCGVTSYSAVGRSMVGACPGCSAPLGARVENDPDDSALCRRLTAGPGSVEEARQALTTLTLPVEVANDLELLVSELVTNSVRYAGERGDDRNGFDDSIELLVTRTDGELRVAVRDRGPGFAPEGLNGVDEEGGRGLLIVEALSKAWGVDRAAHSCTVWCTLAAA